MNGTDLPAEQWFKSSHSNDTQNCVEVALIGDGVATRDSKDPSGPALLFTSNAWQTFVGGLIDGEFRAAMELRK